MAVPKKRDEWQLRRQALILESALNRLTLEADCASLRTAAARFGLGVRGRSWMLGLAPVAALLLIRLARRFAGKARAGRMTTVLSLVQTLAAIWQGFFGAEVRKD